MKSVNYNELIAPLIEAVKELHRDNDLLRRTMQKKDDDLAGQVRALKADNDNLRAELRAMRKEAR
jgi:hypothetical protein